MNLAAKVQEARMAFARWHHLSTEVMAEIERLSGRYLCPHADIERIQRMVAAHYALDVAIMLSPAKPAKIAQARQVAMLLCRQFTKHSQEVVGACFGGRDHGTVRHACARIETLASVDPVLAGDLRLLRERLAAQLNRTLAA